MAEPYRATTSSQLFLGTGVIEIITLVSGGSEASLLAVYDSQADEGISGRRIYDLAAVAADSRSTPVLNIPVKYGAYASISGANAQVVLTKR